MNLTESDISVSAPSQNGHKTRQRDCIIFIPGIGDAEMIDQSIEGVARRIEAAFDTNAANHTAEFNFKIKPLENITGCQKEVGTVYRKDGNEQTPIVDIYKFDYRPILVEPYENRSLLVKTLLLIGGIIGGAGRLILATFARRSAKSYIEKFQLFLALIILALLIFYAIVLCGAVYATLEKSGHVYPQAAELLNRARCNVANVFSPKTANCTAPDEPKKATAEASPTTKSGWWLSYEILLFVFQLIVVGAAVISLLISPKFNMKEIFSNAAVQYLCLIYYLKLGEQRREIIGQLSKLLDQIARKSENDRAAGEHYNRIHLVSFSFGSIIALDAMFPTQSKLRPPFHLVNTLVTIGCPFDFVRMFYPGYFGINRQYESKCPSRWINIYSPVDVLGSNFRDDAEFGEANVNIRATQTEADSDVPKPENLLFSDGVELQRLSLFSALGLLGLRAHGMYWGAKQQSEINCFDELVPMMYGDEYVLS